jgi:hypothetical protein
VILRTKINELRRSNRNELVALRPRNQNSSLNGRYSSSTSAKAFWSKLRKDFKTINSLSALIDEKNMIIRDADGMLELVANLYENLFTESEVYRPHPDKNDT